LLLVTPVKILLLSKEGMKAEGKKAVTDLGSGLPQFDTP
jgi:hypothetical protein